MFELPHHTPGTPDGGLSLPGHTLPGDLNPGQAFPSQGLPSYDGHPVSPMAANYQRTRQMTIGDLLMENRIIFLDGPIHDGNANVIVMQMLYLQSENKHQDIQLYINSPGGSVTAGMAIYDTMQYMDCAVATYCVGFAASMGAILMAGGAPGKRFILPHAKMMVHQPSGEVGGQVSDIEIQAKQIIETRETLNKILSEHTGQDIETITRDTERDRYLSAHQAKEYGLVDVVVEKKKKGEKKKDD